MGKMSTRESVGNELKDNNSNFKGITVEILFSNSKMLRCENIFKMKDMELVKVIEQI